MRCKDDQFKLNYYDYIIAEWENPEHDVHDRRHHAERLSHDFAQTRAESIVHDVGEMWLRLAYCIDPRVAKEKFTTQVKSYGNCRLEIFCGDVYEVKDG